MKKQQAFTLIEMMIVLAIIGIIAAMAVPYYKDFHYTSLFKAAMAETEIIKTNVQIRLQEYFPSTFDPADYGANKQSKVLGYVYISALEITQMATITVHLKEKVNGYIKGISWYLVGKGQTANVTYKNGVSETLNEGDWYCSTAMDIKYLSANDAARCTN